MRLEIIVVLCLKHLSCMKGNLFVDRTKSLRHRNWSSPSSLKKKLPPSQLFSQFILLLTHFEVNRSHERFVSYFSSQDTHGNKKQRTDPFATSAMCENEFRSHRWTKPAEKNSLSFWLILRVHAPVATAEQLTVRKSDRKWKEKTKKTNRIE